MNNSYDIYMTIILHTIPKFSIFNSYNPYTINAHDFLLLINIMLNIF